MTTQKLTSRLEREALDVVHEWLHLERLAHPQRNRNLHRDSVYRLSRPLYDRQIPKRWIGLQSSADYLISGDTTDLTRNLHIGRTVLEATSLAQHGFVMGDIARGGNIFTSIDESWRILEGFKRQLRAGNIPLPSAQNIALPVTEAISKYTRHQYGHHIHTYVGMVAYSASVATQLYDSSANGFVLPTPGLPSDVLVPWPYKGDESI